MSRRCARCGAGPRAAAVGKWGELELLMLQSAFGEYLAQLTGGIAISQVEIVRPADLGIDAAALDTLGGPEADARATPPPCACASPS